MSLRWLVLPCLVPEWSREAPVFPSAICFGVPCLYQDWCTHSGASVYHATSFVRAAHVTSSRKRASTARDSKYYCSRLGSPAALQLGVASSALHHHPIGSSLVGICTYSRANMAESDSSPFARLMSKTCMWISRAGIYEREAQLGVHVHGHFGWQE